MDVSSSAGYSRTHPFPAVLVENRLLSLPGSSHEVRHLSFDLQGMGQPYQAGDSLGVYVANDPREVDEFLHAGGFSAEESVVLPKAVAPVSLRVALERELFLGAPTRLALQTFLPYAGPSQASRLAQLIESPSEVLQEFLSPRFFIDIFLEFSLRGSVPAQSLVNCMKKLQPRIYSIASAPLVHPARVELTVAVVRYHSLNRPRQGVGSTFLADRLPLGGTTGVFFAHSSFHLPERNEAPLIMVGPGTGIAPFRGFLHQRQALSASGPNWLFFGARQQAFDFLYRDELLHFRKTGLLTQLDLAWSRDGQQKDYVQHHLRRHAAQVWQWLQQGAYLYVCGDAKKMAKDVEATLLEIIQTQGNKDLSAAQEFIAQLKAQKRYQKDVY